MHMPAACIGIASTAFMDRIVHCGQTAKGRGCSPRPNASMELKGEETREEPPRILEKVTREGTFSFIIVSKCTRKFKCTCNYKKFVIKCKYK